MCVLLGIFREFPVDPYYEPLAWFMITQASSSFKCLDRCMFMYATPTFIAEVVRLVSLVKLLSTAVTVN